MSLRIEAYTCAWCGERIEDESNLIRVLDSDDDVRATFHDGVCYSEAADYGWAR